MAVFIDHGGTLNIFSRLEMRIEIALGRLFATQIQNKLVKGKAEKRELH